MDVFSCDTCGQLVFFANDRCLRCGSSLAFDPASLRLVVVDDDASRCVNRVVAACNWLAPPGELCASCRLTRTRPADADLDGLAQFRVAEDAKRRLVFQLRSLGIELQPRDEVTGTGVAFDLLASSDEPVMTGHAGGVITLDLAESDDLHREQVRQQLREPYRTVLGHFRHEIGHHLFGVLVGPGQLDASRALFGDETTDYQAALDRHYAQGPPSGWEERFVSAYATMHPAEDIAETVAHYLHIRGVLQSAAGYRLRVDGPPVAADPGALASVPAETDVDDLDAIIAAWLPLTYALNAIGRSLGEGNLYPFVLPPPVIDKLRFVHSCIVQVAARGARIPSG